MYAFNTFVLALAACTVEAHITLWHPSLFGFNYPRQSSHPIQNYGSREMVNPLRANDNLTTDEWFAHGAKGYPPEKGQFLTLVAGESVQFELSCDRSFTTYRDPSWTKPYPHFACEAEGPLHNNNTFNSKKIDPTKFGGTALAIAYTSDEEKLQPGDMTIISVNATSPWERIVTYDIPEGLPPCPKNGCLVTWNWIHLALDYEGYGAEIYNTLYRAKVVGKTDKHNMVPSGKVPVKCENDQSKCVRGPKVPMYLWQKDGNNMEAPKAHIEQNPSYNARYGFEDGAQHDAVVHNPDSGAQHIACTSVLLCVSAVVAALGFA